jgi:hypothetical protein
MPTSTPSDDESFYRSDCSVLEDAEAAANERCLLVHSYSLCPIRLHFSNLQIRKPANR